MSVSVAVVVVACGVLVVAFVVRCVADVVGWADRVEVASLTALFPVGLFVAGLLWTDPVSTVVPGWFALSALVLSAGHPLPLVHDGGWLLAELRPGAPTFSRRRQLTWGLALLGGWVGLGVLGALTLS